jgi:MFS family permease
LRIFITIPSFLEGFVAFRATLHNKDYNYGLYNNGSWLSVKTYRGPRLRGGLLLSLALAMAIRLFGGSLLDRYSKLFIIRVCFALFGVGIICFYKLDSVIFYVLSIVLYGSGLGYIFPALNAIGAEQGAFAQKAGMMSILTMVIDGGFILGSIFSGGLLDMIGLSNTFVFAGAVSLLGVFVTSLAPLREDTSRWTGILLG